MPVAVRYGDICTGHDRCGPRPNVGASNDVFINNKGAHRVGDPWSIHCKHTSVQASGSPNVIVNNRAIARLGDSIQCGSVNAQGSPNTIVN